MWGLVITKDKNMPYAFFNSRFAYVWLPLILLAIQLVIENVTTGALHDRMLTENGPVETLQFLILLAAFYCTTRLLLDLKFKPPIMLSLWALLAALGCFYVGGEEVSWGQHFLNWNTPAYWANINDQDETNLHNTSSWLDQKPRLLLELGVITGGLLLPLYRRIAKKPLPSWLQMVAPAEKLMFIAGLIVFIKIADKFGGVTRLFLFGRSSEVIEFYLYYFIWFYLVDLRQRLKKFLT